MFHFKILMDLYNIILYYYIRAAILNDVLFKLPPGNGVLKIFLHTNCQLVNLYLLTLNFESVPYYEFKESRVLILKLYSYVYSTWFFFQVTMLIYSCLRNNKVIIIQFIERVWSENAPRVSCSFNFHEHKLSEDLQDPDSDGPNDIPTKLERTNWDRRLII